MEALLDDLARIARKAERAADSLDAEPIQSLCTRIREEAERVGRSASGSWLGYHANVYIENLRPRAPGDYFDAEWGFEPGFVTKTSGGPWCEYDYDDVLQVIKERASATDTALLTNASEAVGTVFRECREELLPTLDALLSSKDDPAIRTVRESVAGIKERRSEEEFFNHLASGRKFMSRDSRAYSGGLRSPPHLGLTLWVTSIMSRQFSARDLAKQARYLITYLQKTQKMKGISVGRTDGKVFIGHGRSHVWKDLKDFLQDRLGLKWDEFNREATAGVTTKERLEAMLDDSCFAFIVMTAEDEQADRTKHARANVIHEAGLFQGRLGFKRAIVLLEDGCEEFSNIAGLGQIRFPLGNVAAKFEEIRLVLEREGII